MPSGSTPELRILHLLAPAPYGGLETVVQNLARGQLNRGHRVEVGAVAPDRNDIEPFLSWFQTEGVPVRHLAVPVRRYRLERRLVHETCAELHPTIVHTHGYRADVVSSGPARSMGIPTVTTVHGFTGNSFRNRLYEWLQRRWYRRFDAVVAVSRPQVPVLRASGVNGERIHVIPNALPEQEVLAPGPARTRLGVAADAFHVGWVGRLSPEKGPDVLLEALVQTADEDIESIVASFIGDGPMAESLAQRAEAAGLASRIRVHGALPDAAALIPAFDVLVLSSRTEGTPMVLLEGMLAGVPLIATRVGGIPDVVSEAEAILVPPDDPTALARALRDVAHDPDLARWRAEAARRRATRDFGVDTWVERYDAVYRSIMPEPSSEVLRNTQE